MPATAPATILPPAHGLTPAEVRGLISPAEALLLESRLQALFGLHSDTVPHHLHNIKCIIRRRHFQFAEGISPASKAFMLLHTIGHYFFISSAVQKGVRRYEPIYDTFENANLHIYDMMFDSHAQVIRRAEGESIRGCVPEQVRLDRIAFEVGANRYALLVLDALQMSHLHALVLTYEPADIRYILDVTAHGRAAIVKTDDDYIERYVCQPFPLDEVPDSEGVYEPEAFHLSKIDWQALEDIKLEIHFF